MSQPTVTSVLETLPKPRLIELGRQFGVGLSGTAAKESQIAMLQSSGQVRLQQLVEWMGRDPRILKVRALHEEMDGAVLRAYPKLPGVTAPDPSIPGWSDIVVPPFCIATDEDRAALQAFEDQVVDRLFLLNAERAAAESGVGKGPGPTPRAKKDRKTGETPAGGGQQDLF